MRKLVGKALCAVGLHRPPAGWDTSWCIFWPCRRCGDLRKGGLHP